jgi:hypothetical protein
MQYSIQKIKINRNCKIYEQASNAGFTFNDWTVKKLNNGGIIIETNVLCISGREAILGPLYVNSLICGGFEDECIDIASYLKKIGFFKKETLESWGYTEVEINRILSCFME